MVSTIDIKYKKIIQFILAKEKTNYEELSEYMNVSKRTIAKFMNEIRDLIQNLNVTLIIKQNEGVYFKGDTQELNQEIKRLNFHNTESNDSRVVSLYSKFLLSEDYLKIQDLADEFYVSRSTLESVLKEVRKEFLKQGFNINNDRNGMKLDATEKEKRTLISKLTNYFWGDISYSGSKGEELIIQIQTTPSLEKIFDTETLHKVTSMLNVFSDNSRLVFTDYEYQSLAIHLIIALDRIRQNHILKNKKKDIESNELEEATVLLIELVESEFSISLPVFEKEHLNNHVVAIQMNTLNNCNHKYTVIETDKELKNVIYKGLEHLQADSELKKSVVLHLKAAIKRLQLGLSIYNPYTEKIKLSFPRAFENSVHLVSLIEEIYNIKMNDDEIAFIALHIEAFFERDVEIYVKKSVVLVCSSGLGTSKLLEQRLKSSFSEEIIITKVLSLRDLRETIIVEDLIISTIPITQESVPVIVVSPLLNDEDKKEVQLKLSYKNNFVTNNESFTNQLENDLLFIDTGSNNRQGVLEEICTTLLNKQYASEGVLESALEREEISSTAIGIFAMPHAQIEYIKKSRVAIYINKDGINWNGENVKIIFFFALNQQIKGDINQIYSYFNDLVSDNNTLNKLTKVIDKNEIYQLLKQVK